MVAGGGRHHLVAHRRESIINNADCKILLDQRKLSKLTAYNVCWV
ncbi:MAG: hypothetical protein ACLT1W_12060 [Alistipes onderdonkii]